MKKLTSLLAAGVVLSLAGVGTAAAEAKPAKAEQQVQSQAQQQVAPPRGKAAATANPLYRTGRLANANCTPGSLPKGSTSAYKRFLTRVTYCLNKSWASQFRKAGLSFSKPRLRIITKKVNTPCGRWSSGADGVYCSANRTMYMLITKTNLRNPFPLGITRLMAHEYGHHVQQVSGIWNYYWGARARASRSTQLLLSRRSELQAECFSAVFMNTVRDTLPVTSEEWNYTVDWFRKNGHKAWAQNDHGKGPTQAFWMSRGFNSGSVGSCNTWAASSRHVA
ncbi:neutral zinc metallopeptidase [Nonomuraea sp. LPB2021202275-12-8]|uniref:neutral zinc metallopeptidase n=1 Tax=Nonomuraea sp. LPB2021202275-12-8 TaxID=3120159 RepID=UPI00300DB9B4